MTDQELKDGLEALLDRPVLESEIESARRMDDAGRDLAAIARVLGPRVPMAADEELPVRRYEPGVGDTANEVPAP